MHNLLLDPLIRVRYTDGSTETVSLPDVYPAMLADRVVGFPALRSHQRHAWHAFLAQLGVIALHRNCREVPPNAASEWRDLLCAMTREFDNDEPWRRAGVRNPVFVLDEVDRLDEAGGAAAALLDALDPDPAAPFRDRYLDFPLDLYAAPLLDWTKPPPRRWTSMGVALLADGTGGDRAGRCRQVADRPRSAAMAAQVVVQPAARIAGAGRPSRRLRKQRKRAWRTSLR